MPRMRGPHDAAGRLHAKDQRSRCMRRRAHCHRRQSESHSALPADHNRVDSSHGRPRCRSCRQLTAPQAASQIDLPRPIAPGMNGGTRPGSLSEATGVSNPSATAWRTSSCILVSRSSVTSGQGSSSRQPRALNVRAEFFDHCLSGQTPAPMTCALDRPRSPHPTETRSGASRC